MGGVEFAPDCTTELPGLFVAGEDSGGVHGANRLGGNGVANSTVFGGIAGLTMARWLSGDGAPREPDAAAAAAAIDRAERPFTARGGEVDLGLLRERLHATMWDDAGIVRNAESLARAEAALAELRAEHQAYALPSVGRDRTFNLTWHDWLNLGSLIAVSRAIVCAARARENSRGAHFRDDYPDAGDLAHSTYTRVRLQEGTWPATRSRVRFTRVSPGESLLSG